MQQLYVQQTLEILSGPSLTKPDPQEFVCWLSSEPAEAPNEC